MKHLTGDNPIGVIYTDDSVCDYKGPRDSKGMHFRLYVAFLLARTKRFRQLSLS